MDERRWVASNARTRFLVILFHQMLDPVQFVQDMRSIVGLIFVLLPIIIHAQFQRQALGGDVEVVLLELRTPPCF